MLLIEFLKKSSPNIRTTNKLVSDLINTKHHEIVGVGAQAIAYLHKKFPGKIVKTIQIFGVNDPSYQFLRMVMKHQDNPYFPKIFSVKMYPSNIINQQVRNDMFDDTDATGEFSPPPSQKGYTLYVVTERLTPLKEITEEDLYSFGIRVIPPLPSAQQPSPDIRFRRAFRSEGYREHIRYFVKDLKLKQALRLLEPLFRHYEPDMHKGNIMLRGKQWVFVDPVANIMSEE